MLNPKWLTTFATLANNGSFTQTADKLYMTQPGVSQHIKKLEQALGEELIFRQGKQFELTKTGNALLLFISKQQQHQTEFLAEIKKDNPHQGEIKLACSGAMAMKIYASLLKHQKRYPALSIHLEAAPENRILELLDKNLIDIGICTQQIANNAFSIEKIGEEIISLILPKSMNNIDDFASLMTLGFIDHPDGKHYADLVLSRNFKQYRGIDKVPVRGYVNQLAQILLPVAEGLGFTLLPKSVAESFAGKEKIIALPLENQVSLPLYLVKKRHIKLSARYDEILNLIKEL